MKNIFKIGLLLFMVTAFAACSTSYHYYTAGDDINLKKYKTFAVLPKPEGRKPNAAATDEKSLGAKLNYLNNNRYYNTPEAEQKIKSTTIAAMQSKGLVLQDTNPDLLVRYSTIVDRGWLWRLGRLWLRIRIWLGRLWLSLQPFLGRPVGRLGLRRLRCNRSRAL
jgi:hypothetical protein